MSRRAFVPSLLGTLFLLGTLTSTGHTAASHTAAGRTEAGRTNIHASDSYDPTLSISQAPAGLASSQSELVFDPTAPGDADRHVLILTHDGTNPEQDIVIDSVTTGGADAMHFTTNFTTPVSLGAGESHVLTVLYRPLEAGDHEAILMVSHDGASALELFSLSGRATEPALGQGPGTTANKSTAISARNSGNAPFSHARVTARVASPSFGAVSFGKSNLTGATSNRPTSLQFGPDGRLYVADMLGTIRVYSIERLSTNRYRVTDTESIDLIRDIANHNDDGAPNGKIRNRLVTGLLVTGSAEDPVLYVASSDPRIGGGPSHNDSNLDTNSTMLSRLTRQDSGTGRGWKKTDLVRGLPRSEENHHANGMVLDASGHRLLLAMGGNTNAGATSNNFAHLPEYALSAAILEIDLLAIGDTTYDLPTLDDQDRPGTKDANDPFGGNDGQNQAMLVPGGPVQVYAPGFRNPYDLAMTRDGRLYAIDNGPNAGWGDVPVKEGPKGQCTNALNEPGETHADALHFIDGRGYYAGHANPTRGNRGNTFNTRNPQSPVSSSNAVECDYRHEGQNGSLTSFKRSTNGLIEYRASNFGGAMRGDLLAAGFDNHIHRLELNASGDALHNKSVLFNNVGVVPLDVTAQDDDARFPGTVWVADFAGNDIVVFEPTDYQALSSGNGNGNDPQSPASGGSNTAPTTDSAENSDATLTESADNNDTDQSSDGQSGTSQAGNTQADGTCSASHADGDADGDGYTNADEIANGTNPCSAADLPADVDHDGVSDRLDSDDDNDGRPDVSDPFALDPDNGRKTQLPLAYTWENDGSNPGYLLNLGFSGLMSNGKTDYHDQFDLAEITAGGAAGVLTLDSITAGDAFRARNDQAYGFQFGVDVNPSSPAFVVRTRINAPFAGMTPRPHQAMGFYVGTGDQDNYVKLVVNSIGGATGGLQFAAEKAGAFKHLKQLAAPVKGSEAVDLFLRVDPGARQVQAAYQLIAGGQTGPIVPIAGQAELPVDWLNGDTALAIGIISTSLKASPFSATWDFIVIDEAGGETDWTAGGGQDHADDSNQDAGVGNDIHDPTADANESSDDTNTEDGSDDDNHSDSGGSGSGSGGTNDGSGDDTADTGLLDSARLIVLEAESFTSSSATASHRWETMSRPGTSGTSAMQALPDSGQLKRTRQGSPVLNYRATFAAAGTYDVWVRGWGDTNAQGEGKNDSVHVGLNGVLAGAAAMDQFPTGWHWSNSTRSGQPAQLVVPTAGTHTLSVWMREDGLMIDKLILAPAGASFVPAGLGAEADPTSGGESDTDTDTGTGTGTSAGTGMGENTDPESGAGDTVDAGPVVNRFVEQDGLLVIEPEQADTRQATATHRWADAILSGSSAGGAIQALPDTGTLKKDQRGSPMLTIPVRFTNPGTYSVWVRGWGDTNAGGEGKSDSVHVGLNGKLDTASAVAGFPAGWHWSSARHGGGTASITVPAPGIHQINVWMREDGLAVDKLVLTRADNFTPKGVGPLALFEEIPAETNADSNSATETGNGNTSQGLALNPAARWQVQRTANGSTADARHESGAVALDGKLYLIGGRGNRAVNVYDPASNRWTRKATPPVQLNHFQPVAWGGRIWVIGAMSCCYPREASVPHIYTYTPATDQWERGPAIPGNRLRGSMGAVVHNDLIYLVGGNTRGHDGGAVAWFDEFNPATGRWRTLPSAPQARDHVQVAIAAGKLVVAGGRQSQQPDVFGHTISRTDIYDFDSGRWSRGAAIPTQRAGALAVRVGDEVLVMGGEIASSVKALDKVEAFNAVTGNWRRLPALADGVHSGGAAIVGGSLHVVAGSLRRGGSGETDRHQVLRLH